MGGQQSWRQPDLFGAAAPAVSVEPMPESFVARIRAELTDTPTLARAAETLPWRDLTATTLAELRFHSIARWLPAEEAQTLRASFKIEMARLYAAIGEPSVVE